MCRGDLPSFPPLVTRLIPSWFTASVEKAWLDEILFFEVVILMVKNKKICAIKDTMPIKINLMHYRNVITWTRAKLPVAFEGFDTIYIFGSFFLFIIIASWQKVNLGSPPPTLQFLRAWVYLNIKFQLNCLINFWE